MIDFESTQKTLIQKPSGVTIHILSRSAEARRALFPTEFTEFTDIITLNDASDAKIFLTKTTERVIMFVDTEIGAAADHIFKLVYAVHTQPGIIFAFSFHNIDDTTYNGLIYFGFDDVFDLSSRDSKLCSRIYSWIRRFVGNPARSGDPARPRSPKKITIAGWDIFLEDMQARRDGCDEVALTRQEVDFLSSLCLDCDALQQSNKKLFKAPHAIANKLRKKLGSDFPLVHDGRGQYSLQQRIGADK
jgi:hypothetical protein